MTISLVFPLRLSLLLLFLSSFPISPVSLIFFASASALAFSLRIAERGRQAFFVVRSCVAHLPTHLGAPVLASVPQPRQFGSGAKLEAVMGVIGVPVVEILLLLIILGINVPVVPLLPESAPKSVSGVGPP